MLIDKNIVVVIALHVKCVLALILSETTLRFDQLISSLSSDGLMHKAIYYRGTHLIFSKE